MAIPHPQEPFCITPVYERLLIGDKKLPLGLYHFHLMTAAQLCDLHYSAGSAKYVKALLKDLVDAGYVQEDWTPTRLLRSPYIYMLGQRTIEYLRDIGMDVPGSFRAAKEIGKSYLHIQHTLETNDLTISAALLKWSNTSWQLAEFRHERELKQDAYHTLSYGKPHTLIPDAFLDFRQPRPDGRHNRRPVALEHDCDTEQRASWRQKIRSYIKLLTSEHYKQWFDVDSLTIAVTTFAGTKRIAQLREWTRQELEGEPKWLTEHFLFAALTKPLDPRSVWIDGDWYMPGNDEPVALLEEK